MTDDDKDSLVESVSLLTLTLAERFMATPWDDPEAVAAADRLMRVLYAYGRNIEKCITMTEKHRSKAAADCTADDTEELREALYRRLVRYAGRLGREELANRLKERGLDQSGLRLDVLGENGSNPTKRR
ncbi:MAG: hypothetical protein AAF986_01485 [Pseudomonadota bacterium]